MKMRNPKTTIGGALAGIPLIIEGFQTKNYGLVAAGIGMLLCGLFAKDHNVTGTGKQP